MSVSNNKRIENVNIQTIDKTKIKPDITHRSLHEFGLVTKQSQQIQQVIFLLEDEPDVNMLCKETLEKSGFKVFAFTNPVDAAALIDKEKPDLIISNIMLPLEDGIHFLEDIRNNPDWKNIPFVFFTNLDTEQLRTIAFQIGVDAYLPKANFTMDTFAKEITKFMKQKTVR